MRVADCCPAFFKSADDVMTAWDKSAILLHNVCHQHGASKVMTGDDSDDNHMPMSSPAIDHRLRSARGLPGSLSCLDVAPI